MARVPAARFSVPSPEKKDVPLRKDAVSEHPPATTPETPKQASWGWRLTLGLWMLSFGFLFLYEILQAIFRVLGR